MVPASPGRVKALPSQALHEKNSARNVTFPDSDKNKKPSNLQREFNKADSRRNTSGNICLKDQVERDLLKGRKRTIKGDEVVRDDSFATQTRKNKEKCSEILNVSGKKQPQNLDSFAGTPIKVNSQNATPTKEVDSAANKSDESSKISPKKKVKSRNMEKGLTKSSVRVELVNGSFGTKAPVIETGAHISDLKCESTSVNALNTRRQEYDTYPRNVNKRSKERIESDQRTKKEKVYTTLTQNEKIKAEGNYNERSDKEPLKQPKLSKLFEGQILDSVDSKATIYRGNTTENAERTSDIIESKFRKINLLPVERGSEYKDKEQMKLQTSLTAARDEPDNSRDDVEEMREKIAKERNALLRQLNQRYIMEMKSRKYY